MNFAEFQLQALSDPRLAAFAASPLPAWLWSADGTRILWANPAGADVFGATDGAALAARIFGPADRHRRQVARLAGRFLAGGAIRLERLQGFGAAPGMLATCGCTRFDFPDGSHGILIAAGAAAGRARTAVAATAKPEASRRRSRPHRLPTRRAVAPPAHPRRRTGLMSNRRQPVEAPRSSRCSTPSPSRPKRRSIQPDACGSSARSPILNACCNSICRMSKPRNRPAHVETSLEAASATSRSPRSPRHRHLPLGRCRLRSGCRYASRGRWIEDDRFTLTLGRVHPPDRTAHRRRPRPAVARDRRNVRPRSRRPRRAGASPPARPGAASR